MNTKRIESFDMWVICFFVLRVPLPGVPAGFRFLLLLSPLSKELAKGSEEGDGAVEVVSMGGGFGDYMLL